MQITWSEINERAVEFVHEWRDARDEKAEAQTFWNQFFYVFGMPLRRVAVFEKHVKLSGNQQQGFVDLFWKGTLIAEHKSRGKSLDAAYKQVLYYMSGIIDEELPRYIILSDFQRFRLYDLDEGEEWSFELTELPRHIHLFDFMTGHKRHKYPDVDIVNIKAAELMGRLHDALKANGYTGHALELLLVRFMFCLFADDTAIFEKGLFAYYIEERTREDGADVGAVLTYIFQLLNTPEDARQINLDDDAAKFPYINGSLFDETLPIATFDRKTRDILLKCCYFDWSTVSPAIFGSLFQAVVEPQERRDFGVHYTSEKNILKVIRPLFLDGLYAEFEARQHNKRALNELLGKIGSMKFLDPACGCGSFLVVAYKELRRLELVIHKQLQRLESKNDQYRGMVLDVVEVFNRDINVDSFYGIDLFEFPVRIAEVALWLTDHQANIELQNEFGHYYARLPLIKAPHVIQGNALTLDWEDIIPKSGLSYIFGNPPYVGKHLRSDAQNDDMDIVFADKIRNYKTLDYVCSWYVKTQEFISGTDIQTSFVSTNSITQGEQVGILWNYLLASGIKINFAHRTFVWSNQARRKAAVFVVIIGFATFDRKKKQLFEYVGASDEPLELQVTNINPYLVEAENIVMTPRKKPICNVPAITWGNKPVDGQFLLLTDSEKNDYVTAEPSGVQYIRPLISAKEFLHNEKRWCFWLTDVNPATIRRLPLLRQRIASVRKFRLASKKKPTRRLADQPYLFAENRQPKTPYIAVPRHTSENRRYIPLAICEPNVIVHDSMAMIRDVTAYHFGVLQSAMHMTWVHQVCGRLKGDFRYSNDIVYNNFPWPSNPLSMRIDDVMVAAKGVIRARHSYPDTSLADLYDPLSMPKQLLDAHRRLDKAVDRCYRVERFDTDLERLQFLFGLFKEYTS